MEETFVLVKLPSANQEIIFIGRKYLDTENPNIWRNLGVIGKGKRIGGLSVANFSLISSLWRCLLPPNPLSEPLASRRIFLSSHFFLLFLLYHRILSKLSSTTFILTALPILSSLAKLRDEHVRILVIGGYHQIRYTDHASVVGKESHFLHMRALVFQENLSYILPTLPTARRYPRYLTHVEISALDFGHNIFRCLWHYFRWNMSSYVDTH